MMNDERDLGYEASAATQRLNDRFLSLFLTIRYDFQPNLLKDILIPQIKENVKNQDV